MSDVRACFPVIVVESALEQTKGVYNMEDKQIVDLYWERSEFAIKETEKKYGKYCHYIAYQILENDGDAEEVVNDTYLKTWQTIPPKRPEALKPYVGMICRHRALMFMKNEILKKEVKYRWFSMSWQSAFRARKKIGLLKFLCATP